jgi:hypothetical protein
MAPIDYDEDVHENDDKYHESSDEDFNPETAPAEEASSSEDEDQDNAVTKATQRKGKRKAPIDAELDSGDEVTIQAARKKRSKKDKKGSKDDDEALILSDDEGGEGGLIKTRAQRRVEQKERRPLARTEGATVDVDALWAQMTAVPLKPVDLAKPQAQDAPRSETTAPTSAPVAIEEELQITVKKVYTFAGQDTTEEKQIPQSQLDKYISDGWKPLDAAVTAAPIEEQKTTTKQAPRSKIRRPLRRPTRFDPNPTGYVRALAPEHQLFWPRKGITTLPAEQENASAPTEASKAKVEKAQKLNVVDKSRMDWTGFVDKEGIAEELDTHGKTKEAYLGRMEFLAGVEARREEERRNAKMKAAAITS